MVICNRRSFPVRSGERMRRKMLFILTQYSDVVYHIYDHVLLSEALKFVQTLFFVLCVWADIRINCKYCPTS